MAFKKYFHILTSFKQYIFILRSLDANECQFKIQPNK